jgi:hypothetical protein
VVICAASHGAGFQATSLAAGRLSVVFSGSCRNGFQSQSLQRVNIEWLGGSRGNIAGRTQKDDSLVDAKPMRASTAGSAIGSVRETGPWVP